MAAGLGFKTFTSGEVLTAADTNGYLMQGILVFANASARTAAITSPQEGQYSYLKDTNSTEYYDGSAWVAGVEGDISGVTAGTGITGGGTSGTVTVSLDQTNYGGGQFAAGKNKIINGDYGVWARGTTFSNPANQSYLADRWFFNASGSGATRTISQQTFTPGTAPVAGYEGQYYFRYARTVAGSGATADHISQRIEDVRTFAGQTATMSFWAKVDSGTPTLTLRARQNFGSGGSTLVDATDVSVTLSTSWTRYTATFAIPSISGKTIGTSSNLELQFRTAVNTIQTLDLWGVQVEAGSVATPFQTATGTLQGELAACQRYYYRTAPGFAGAQFGLAAATGTTTASIVNRFPVTMRTRPSALEQSGTANQYAVVFGGTVTACSAVATYGGSTTQDDAVLVFTVASGLTSGQAGRGISDTTNGANAYLGWSAEL